MTGNANRVGQSDVQPSLLTCLDYRRADSRVSMMVERIQNHRGSDIPTVSKGLGEGTFPIQP